MGNTLIVVPTYNESENLTSFVKAIRQSLPSADLLIVDDDSPDGTGKLADDLGKHDPQVRVLHRSGKLGLGTAYVAGFKKGLNEGYERFFEMDADHSHDPKYLPNFVQKLDEGYDVVVGSRNIPGGSVQGWGLGRHIISKGGSIYSRLVLGLQVRDLTGGYNAFTRRALEALGIDALKSNGYSFQIEMKYRAIRRGLKLIEIPIVFVDRQAGRSKMSRKVFAEAAWVVWKLRADGLRGRI